MRVCRVFHLVIEVVNQSICEVAFIEVYSGIANKIYVGVRAPSKRQNLRGKDNTQQLFAKLFLAALFHK